MFKVKYNPPNLQELYLQSLNSCFPNWGDYQKYQWYFERQTCFPKTDLLVLQKGEELVAGSAVSYRQIALANGENLLVGIMTGSWTLPQARGQGCFTQIIQESIELTRQKGGGLLLAFVTEENKSFSQLVKAGAATFASSYVFSTPESSPARNIAHLRLRESSPQTLDEMFQLLNPPSHSQKIRFVYPTAPDMAANLVFRPAHIHLWQSSSGQIGIIEEKPETYLIQYIMPSALADHERALIDFVNHALTRQKKVFLYSTHSKLNALYAELKLKTKAGYITALTADAHALQKALKQPHLWHEQTSTSLALPTHPWFLGEWNVQSGDRT